MDSGTRPSAREMHEENCIGKATVGVASKPFEVEKCALSAENGVTLFPIDII